MINERTFKRIHSDTLDAEIKTALGAERFYGLDTVPTTDELIFHYADDITYAEKDRARAIAQEHAHPDGEADAAPLVWERIDDTKPAASEIAAPVDSIAPTIAQSPEQQLARDILANMIEMNNKGEVLPPAQLQDALCALYVLTFGEINGLKLS